MPQSRSGRFGEEKKLLGPTKIRTPNRPARSLVTILTALSRILSQCVLTYSEILSTHIHTTYPSGVGNIAADPHGAGTPD